MTGQNRRGAQVFIWLFTIAVAALGLGAAPAWSCVGDCNQDNSVTVDEVLTGVSIALGARPLSECVDFDGNGDAQVTVDEVILALNNALGGCPDLGPTPTPTNSHATATPVPTASPTASASPTATQPSEIGPVITYFGLATADGFEVPQSGTTANGLPIFNRVAGAGFMIVVEGRPGTSGSTIGQCNSSYDEFSPEARPDLQILSNRNLGAGNPAVCDGPVGPATGFNCGGRPPFILPLGGIPAVDPPDFNAPTRAVADALNDFGCRMAYFTAAESCTQSEFRNFRYLRAPQSTDQFCTSGVVSPEMLFPSGDTILTARLRDFAGNPGPQARIVVRVP